MCIPPGFQDLLLGPVASSYPMQRLASVFQDVHGLHARIDIFLKHTSVLRVGLVPLKSRNDLSSVLTALVDEPIQKTAWGEAIASRPLTKDLLVTQSPEFTYIESQNSLTVYPVPFPGKPIEYLEVNSIKDSWDHLKTCHLWLMLGDEASTKPEKVDFPWLFVVDHAGQLSKPAGDLQYDGDLVEIDSKLALSANELLQSSPKNAGKYMELRAQSQIGALSFAPKSVYSALKNSIFRSCEEQINALPEEDAQVVEQSSTMRREWSNAAHGELQGSLLPELRQILARDFAFYKLYFHSDDILPEISSYLATAMPQSKNQFQFLLGRAGSEHPSQKDLVPTAELVSKLSKESLKSVLTALGIQVPLVGVAIGGSLMGLSAFSMGSVALLGLFVGFRKMQTMWLAATQQFLSNIEDRYIAGIQKGEEQLWTIGERKAHEVESKRIELKQALEEARQQLRSPQAEAQPTS